MIANKTTVTIRDVAKMSGFSASTVSIVLNNAPLARYIPPQTKARIQKAAKTLGYFPNVFAKSLRSKRNHTVGVMVFDITDPYCTPILRGIENSPCIRRRTCRSWPTLTTSAAVLSAIWKCCWNGALKD